MAGLASHRGPNAGLDSGPFALGHSTEDRHDEVVSFGLGVDRPTHFGNPERDAVMAEDRKRQGELVTVERSLRLTDHDGFEPARRIGECAKEARGLGSARRRGARAVDRGDLILPSLVNGAVVQTERDNISVRTSRCRGSVQTSRADNR